MKKKMILIAVGVILCAVLIAMVFFLNNPKPIDFSAAKSGDILVDYYSAVVGTLNGNRHTELVLSATDDPAWVKLEIFEKPADGEETVVTYRVPFEAAERCGQIISENKIAKWNRMKNTAPLTGGAYSLKYFDGKGWTTVTSDSMPMEGARILQSIGSVIQEYEKDEYLVG